MFELLFLLLPFAAAYGYYMGRQSVRDKKEKSSTVRNNNYLRGVEYLLNNEKDRAVDKFIAYLNESDPSFESNLALGNLFRKRGEVDRAISLHEALANNPKLDVAENEISRVELARDFISAGLLDRAERILLDLVDIPRQHAAAAALLVKVYEQERDYHKAIEIALTYRSVLGSSSLSQLSHYYCQCAVQDVMAGNRETAYASYQHALDVYPNSVRARLEYADLLIKDKKLKEAYIKVKEVSEIDPNSGLLCLDLIRKCFPNKADPDLRFALEDLVRRTHSAEAMVDLVQSVELISGKEDAEVQLLAFIKEKPSLKLFSALIGLRSRDNDDAKANDVVVQLKSLIDAQTASNPRFSCSRCGFKSRMMFWQCPSCRRWDTITPIRGLDGD